MLAIPQAETVFEHVRDVEPPPDLVTVAVSLYNYAEFLPDCLDSVLAQRHGAIELVVVDDVSAKDDSVAVAHEWMQAHKERFSRALLLRHKRNQGLAQARNTAFEHARASHVFVMDADNAIYPRAIGRLRQAIATSRAAAAYTQMELFGTKHTVGLADVWRPEWLRHGNYIDAMALISRLDASDRDRPVVRRRLHRDDDAASVDGTGADRRRGPGVTACTRQKAS